MLSENTVYYICAQSLESYIKWCQVTNTKPPIAFFEKTYNDAVALLSESRDYLKTKAPNDLNHIDVDVSLYLTNETTRVTGRLTEIMAWLLAQKASIFGHVPQPGYTFKLSESDTFIENSVETSPYPLPQDLRNLLIKTHELYTRVQHLDRMIRQTGGFDINKKSL